MQSYTSLDEDDIDKLYQSGVLDINTPRGLQRKVWFELMLFICRCGRENFRKLEKDHAVAVDSNGRKYVYQCKDEMTKRICGDNMKSGVDAGRMYATEGEGCPVASFEKYVSKLNPKYSAFFQTPYPNRPSASTDNSPWYKNAPVCEKTLENMMSNMSTQAGLSKRFTNRIVFGPVTETLHPRDFWRPLFLETLAIGLLNSGCLQKSQCWIKT